MSFYSIEWSSHTKNNKDKEFSKEMLAKGLMAIIHSNDAGAFPRDLWIDAVFCIYDFKNIENTGFDNCKSLRQHAETFPELFYFIKSKDQYFMKQYIRNLVSLNPFVVIDDIIYEKLSFLDDKVVSRNVLFWTHQLLLYRSFSRTTLKHIFNNVVYLDFEGDNEANFYKYGILMEIVKQYKVGDLRIAENAVNSEQSLHQLAAQRNSGMANSIKEDCAMIDTSELDEDKVKDRLVDEFLDNKDVGNDNTQVLANIIWENTILILEGILCRSLDRKVHLSGVFKDFDDPNCFEATCIVELFSVIIENTAQFYQNRISKSVGVLQNMKSLPSFERFIEKITENFEKSEDLLNAISGRIGS
ncbi:uncharacterized protein VICG_01243 [Vittaforma corneae ATCC 50505]|uniref:Uncharacterized protein n=1 Tax=Vittaforma corneae (strain ATCC 50505) TaxID=993615 RepID=L2GM79_VITCO|nr:uncharacterized protein VICG_01243 [Vittaforma corneae ATCC 50505]ELA41739.1 hypothetical protein VICG_01243 [Vittaforma corneae ATCC 50505]